MHGRTYTLCCDGMRARGSEAKGYQRYCFRVANCHSYSIATSMNTMWSSIESQTNFTLFWFLLPPTWVLNASLLLKTLKLTENNTNFYNFPSQKGNQLNKTVFTQVILFEAIEASKFKVTKTWENVKVLFVHMKMLEGKEIHIETFWTRI